MPEINDKVEEALKVIFKELNTIGKSNVGETLAAHLQSEHRTLQQNFFREFMAAMYIYKDGGSDLRNEQSVKLAKMLADMDYYFPYV